MNDRNAYPFGPDRDHLRLPKKNPKTGGIAAKAEPGLLLGLRRFIDGRRIEAAVPPQLRRKGVVASYGERLGGLTNQNYKLYVGGQAHVLRLPGRGTGRFINRSTERANQEAAAKANFTPSSIFFDGRTGVKITPYLSEARALDPASAREPKRAAAVAVLLSRFHSSSIRFVNDFNVFRLADIYERVARLRFARFFEGYHQIRARVLALERPLNSISGVKVACHNDLVPENILETRDGLTLIDWEYSGMNDPAWDIASFTLESGFDEAQDRCFIAAYSGGLASPRLRLRVEAYRLLQDFLWSLWSLLQETASHDPAKASSYREYGQDRFDRAVSRLSHVESKFGFSRVGEEPKR
jgi:thiamine kinase-like enzyme